MSWWGEYLDRGEKISALFAEEIASLSPRDSVFGRIHGDLTVANIVRDSRGKLWVFDWENCCQDVPVLADEIGFFIEVNRLRSGSDDESLLKFFRDRYFDRAEGPSRGDIMYALAFRSTVNPAEAWIIMSRWDSPARVPLPTWGDAPIDEVDSGCYPLAQAETQIELVVW